MLRSTPIRSISIVIGTVWCVLAPVCYAGPTNPGRVQTSGWLEFLRPAASTSIPAAAFPGLTLSRPWPSMEIAGAAWRDSHSAVRPTGIPGGRGAALGMGGPVIDDDTQAGVIGSDAANVISVSSPLVTEADSSANGFDISLSLGGDAGADVSVTSTSTATAVAGNGGDDTITISSTLDATAVAQANIGSLTFNLFDNASANGAVTSYATATGVSGDAGDDTMTVADGGAVTVFADSLTLGGTFDLTLVDVLGGHVDATLNAHAAATGIAGGAGNDTITNNGTITVTAEPNVTSGTVNLSLLGNPAYETSRLIQSTATGIAGGEDNDVITNNGTITVEARGSIVGLDFTFDHTASDISSADAKVASNAVAIGIDGGTGNDTIINNDLVDVNAAGTVVTGAGIVGSISIDPFEAEASVDQSPSAVSVATGLAGGEGNDTLENHGTLLIDATPTLTSTEFDFAVLGTISATAANRADGAAIGMDGGSGDDTITNDGTITAAATTHANVNAIDAALTLVPVPTGLVFTNVNATAVSSADSIGIEGGRGNDTITNSGDITANATARMTSIEVAAKLGLDSGGSSGGGGGGGGRGGSGASLSALGDIAGEGDPVDTSNVGAVDASTVRESFAAAISGGQGADIITNTGAINVTTDALSVEVNVDASLSVEITRVAAAAQPNMSSALNAVEDPTGIIDGGTIARSIVRSTALGVDGGNGADTIINSAAINATALATATNVGAKASIAIPNPANPVSWFDLGVGVDARSFTQSLAVGIAGGGGADGMLNEDVITVLAGSSSTAVAVELNTQITVPLPMFFDPVSDVTGLTSAQAFGMHGDDPIDDALDADDMLDNAGTLNVTAESSATGVSVIATLGGSAIGAAVTASDAEAFGMAGGGGADIVRNAGMITATSDASATGVGVHFTLAPGAAETQAFSVSDATAVGIDGGDGDDTLINQLVLDELGVPIGGTITALATATSDVTSVDIESIGGSIASASSSAIANATGIVAGGGHDTITSSGTIDVDASATADVDQVVIAATIGASVSDSATMADAVAAGIHGWGDDDSITWTGLITVDAVATATAGSVGVTANGASVNSTGLVAGATVFGVHGGDGVDVINAMGELSVHSTADAGSTSVQITGTGAAVANATTFVTASSMGVGGGNGGDTITISENLTAGATAQTDATGVAVNLIGAGVQTAGVTVDADARGVSGGLDDDAILNLSTIDIDATSTGHAGVVDVNLIGASVGDASLLVIGQATGISGGNGNDLAINQGTILADATGTATLSNFAFSLAGVASADLGDASTNAQPRATGMAGDFGNDTLQNESTIDVTATASLSTSTSAAIDIFGVAGVDAIVSASSTATGMSGGEGDDVLLNLDLVDVTSSATMDLLAGTAFSFGGVASDDAEVSGSASAFGLAGGGGGDSIRSEGSIVSAATATLDVDSNSKVVFGVSSASSQTHATALAYGIDGGDGVDAIENLGSIDATSTATTTATQSSWAFGGAPSTSAVLESTSVATAIRGAFGGDWIHNGSDGTLEATAISTLTSTSGASATFGSVETSATVGASTTAIGIHSEAGRDTVINEGEISVLANGAVSASNDSDAGFFFGEAGAEASASGRARVRGIRSGGGSDDILNYGLISVTLDDTSGSATVHAQSDSNGGDITFEGDARTTSTASLTATAVGIGGGKGNNRLTNTGEITVLNAPKVSASSVSDGDGIDGDGFGSAHVDVGTFEKPVSAIGIAARDGDNIIVNDGTLNVEASPRGTASVVIDGDVSGGATGDAVTTVRAYAAGIVVGHGVNSILNNGTITVQTDPSATATSNTSPGWAGGSFQVADAAAVGNSVGIQAGDGGNTIVNTGLIDVRADATASVSVTDEDFDPDTDFIMDFETENRTVVGIRTGSGSDRIVNAGDGMITTRVNGINGAGIGIDSGAGDDLVRLLDESTVVGEIRLGEGDDVIAIGGTAGFSDQIIGGDGFDTLRIAGRRTHSMASTDLGLEQLDVNKGRLELDGDYSLLDGGGLQVDLFNGGHGVLAVNGEADISGDSTITVNARPRAYVDGETFDVMTGIAVNGTFANEDLTNSFFLDFDVTYLPDAVRIETAVKPFAVAARSRAGNAMAGYLDAITPNAAGDLAELIGEIQLLTNLDAIQTAFSTLSPQSYDGLSRTSFDVGRSYARMLHGRMRTLSDADAVAGASRQSARMSPTSDFSLGALQDAPATRSAGSDAATFGFWLGGVGQWGSQDAGDGFAGLDYSTAGATLGFDHLFGEHFIGGAAIGYSGTDVDFDGNTGSGDITGYFGSFYGGWSRDNAWIDATLSYGLQDYDNNRRVVVGGDNRLATSSHDGSLIVGSLAGGMDFDLNREWTIEPYAAAYYAHLNEDGFREQGAGSANLLVEDRSTNSLMSELGVRLAGRLERKATIISPYVAAAWLHDFEIDDPAITSAFIGTPGTSFTLDGLNIDADRLRVEAGVGIANGNLSGSLSFFAEFAGDYNSHGILGSVGIRF